MVLEGFEAAEVFCQAGLVSSAYDAALLNTTLMHLRFGGKAQEAIEVLSGVDASKVEGDRVKVALRATRGLADWDELMIDESFTWKQSKLQGAF